MNRLRHQIIDLNTLKVYMNESMIEKELGISRYYVRKSLKEYIPVKGNKMFSYYSYGMDIDYIKNVYEENLDNKIKRSKKWNNLMMVAQSTPTSKR